MGRPRAFNFSIEDGDPVRLATAIRDILQALDALTDSECTDVVRAFGEMYGASASPDLIDALEVLDALEGIVKNHDAHGHVDESWWQAARDAVARARNGR